MLRSTLFFTLLFLPTSAAAENMLAVHVGALDDILQQVSAHETIGSQNTQIQAFPTSQLAETKRLYAEIKTDLQKLKQIHTHLSEFTDAREEAKFSDSIDTVLIGELEADDEMIETATALAASGGPFDPTTFLGPMKAAAQKLRRSLNKYWKGGQPLRDGFLIPPEHPSYPGGRDFVAKKFARVLVHNLNFTVGAIGSSVSAGHDNCAYDSYENQLERTMAPVWSAARAAEGSKYKGHFVVRNAGEGGGCGDSFENQIYCTRHMVGDDVDAVHYTWTYFENDKDIAAQDHESFIRFVLAMKNAPAPLFFNTGGFNGREQCVTAMDSSGKLLDAYSKYGVNMLCLELGLKSGGYAGKKWGAIGDGLHTTTRYGEQSVPPPLSASVVPDAIDKRRKSLGVVFRNWHPGPLGFQYISDAMAYYYLDALISAIDLITSNAPGGGAKVALIHDTLAKHWPAKVVIPTPSVLPKPVLCDAAICGTGEPPSCMNAELPTFGRHQIFMLPKENSLNPYKQEYGKDQAGWKLVKGNQLQLIPDEEAHIEECKHDDRCVNWMSEGTESGFITFRLPKMTVGRIVVCGNNQQDAFLKTTTQWIFNGDRLDNSNMKKVYRKCVELQPSFLGIVKDTSGHCNLGVRSATPIKISHIIAQ